MSEQEMEMARYAREQGVSEDTARVMWSLDGEAMDQEEVVLVCRSLLRPFLRDRLWLLSQLYDKHSVTIHTFATVCRELSDEGGLSEDIERMMHEIVEAWG